MKNNPKILAKIYIEDFDKNEKTEFLSEILNELEVCYMIEDLNNALKLIDKSHFVFFAEWKTDLKDKKNEK